MYYWIEKYSRVFRSIFSLNRNDEFLNIISVLDHSSGSKTLDVGSGDGYWTKRLSYKFDSVIGIDPNHELQNIAKRYFGSENITYLNGQSECLPFESDYFDNVLSISCIEHFDNPTKSLMEMVRVLKPGGHLSVSVDSLIESNSSTAFRDWHSKRHFVNFYFSENELITLIENHSCIVDRSNIIHLFNSRFSVYLRMIYIKNPKLLALLFPLFYIITHLLDLIFKPNHGQIIILSAIKKF